MIVSEDNIKKIKKAMKMIWEVDDELREKGLIK